MNSEENQFDKMLQKLEKIKKELIHINEVSGTNKRVEAMQQEILKIGWKGILSKYHPDINTTDPASKELFAMYKYVYEDMVAKLKVKRI